MDLPKYIPRSYKTDLLRQLKGANKIICLYGPRQVGKTTFCRELLQDFDGPIREINGDLYASEQILSSRNLDRLMDLVSGYEVLFVDEAQRIPDIGINLKILHDNVPKVKILVTGSSSLELANRVQEPLTGRILTYHLYPIALQELAVFGSKYDLDQHLEQYLLYGMYPDILNTPDPKDKIRALRELVGSYLYRDVLDLTNIKHPDKITDLLQLLALQVGSEVSLSELGGQLGMAKETVESYLDLLEKSFVLYRQRGFSRNLRKEISKMNKYFFADNGVRNALINNFNPLRLRTDKGSLWENFLLSERRKYLAYTFEAANTYFWRTYDQQEIDYIEDSGGQLSGFEIKFGSKIGRAPKAWSNAYPQAKFKTINRDNYLKFTT